MSAILVIICVVVCFLFCCASCLPSQEDFTGKIVEHAKALRGKTTRGILGRESIRYDPSLERFTGQIVESFRNLFSINKKVDELESF
jgi:hypothetical protein